MPRINKRKRTKNQNTLRRRKLYALRKAALVAQLGGKCANCGTAKDLTFDHIFPRNWHPREVHATKRLKIYAEEAAAGKIQLLCGSCNSRKGRPANESDGDF